MGSPFYKNIESTRDMVDSGLRAHMQRVYNFMGGGLAITGAVAYFTSTSAMIMNLLFSSQLMAIIVGLAPLGVVLALSWRINKIEASTAQLLFWVFSTLMGVSLSSVFIIYTGASIATTFFITSTMFLSMSIYGYVTETDLSKMGSILIMGVFGLIIASLVNLFLNNSMMELIISLLGVVIFTGLTAYDTQNIKNIYSDSDSAEIGSKKAVIGALSLYMDFVNLFLYILRFMGARRD